MDRRKLEITKLVNSLGFIVKSIEQTKRSHFHVVITNGNINITSIFPNSASDCRWQYNKRAEIKRRFREAVESGAPGAIP